MARAFLRNYCISVYVGILKKLVIIFIKECHSQKIDKLASKSIDKQAKGKVCFLHVLLSRLSAEGTNHISGRFPASNNLIKNILYRGAQYHVLIWHSSIDSQVYHKVKASLALATQDSTSTNKKLKLRAILNW